MLVGSGYEVCDELVGGIIDWNSAAIPEFQGLGHVFPPELMIVTALQGYLRSWKWCYTMSAQT